MQTGMALLCSGQSTKKQTSYESKSKEKCCQQDQDTTASPHVAPFHSELGDLNLTFQWTRSLWGLYFSPINPTNKTQPSRIPMSMCDIIFITISSSKEYICRTFQNVIFPYSNITVNTLLCQPLPEPRNSFVLGSIFMTLVVQ